MAATDNKGLQFFVTLVVFLLLFLGFYYFMSKGDKGKETAKVEIAIAYVNDGAAYISGLKAENALKIAIGETIVWAPNGAGLYYLDNYAKLKYYDIKSTESKDIFINVASFAVSPKGDLIAVVEKNEAGHLKIITSSGEPVADLDTGTAPCWFREGERIAYISGGAVYDAAGGDWNSYPLYNGAPNDLSVSPDGKSILFTEWKGTESRLVLLDIATKGTSVVESAAFEAAPTDASPLGFSYPRFFADKNAALFVYNDKKGGKIYRFDRETKAITGISDEGGPIDSLSISPSSELVAYFFILKSNFPNFTEKVGDKQVPMDFGPKDLNTDSIARLYARGAKGEIGGDKLNNHNTKQLLDSDVIRIVDLKRSVVWSLGSGQYPALK